MAKQVHTLRLTRQIKEWEDKLQKIEARGKPKHATHLEKEYEKLLKSAISFNTDCMNISVFCWKDLEGYKEVLDNAKDFMKRKYKGLKEKKDQLRVARAKFLKEQA